MNRTSFLLAAAALATFSACAAPSVLSGLTGEPEVARFTQEIPPGASPDACWGKQVTPAILETETR